MPWHERRLTERGVGVELTGERITPELSQADRQAVRNATARYGVTVIPGQDLSDDGIYDFFASLGDKVVELPAVEDVPAYKRGVIPIGNVDKHGNILPVDDWNVRHSLANEFWHVDMTFLRPRATLSLLYGRVVPPEGGNTEFCDTRLFWESLEDHERAWLATLTCAHSVIHSRRKTGFTDWPKEALERYSPVERPLVMVQPATGRTALTLAAYIESVAGMTEAESETFVEELTARATVRENVYCHLWRRGDLVLWDNSCMMHRATPFDMAAYARDMRGARLCDPASL